MPVSKTEAAPDYVDMISIKEIRQLLRELERLGYVKRTGEFGNGNPAYVITAAGKEG